jgi:protein phosphatase 2C family protein 2/3
MEDAHSLHLSLPPSSGTDQGNKASSAPEQPVGSSMTNVEGDDGPAFFGVFDGHGGMYLANRLSIAECSCV